MRIAQLLILTLFATASWSGPIASQFSSGHDGIPWGATLANVVGIFPSGQHYFATTTGGREYSLFSDVAFLGVPRIGMETQYGFDKDNRLYIVGINIPYEYREQLLGTLIASFGTYSSRSLDGTTLLYSWPKDHGLTLTVRTSQNPEFGILQVVISRCIQ
jgi:fluoride ion exporter CrcB/FEX